MSENELRLDTAEVGERILGRWAEIRRHTRKAIIENELFKPEGAQMDQHREWVLESLRNLVKEKATQYGFPKELGGQSNPGGSLSSFEELVLFGNFFKSHILFTAFHISTPMIHFSFFS